MTIFEYSGIYNSSWSFLKVIRVFYIFFLFCFCQQNKVFGKHQNIPCHYTNPMQTHPLWVLQRGMLCGKGARQVESIWMIVEHVKLLKDNNNLVLLKWLLTITHNWYERPKEGGRERETVSSSTRAEELPHVSCNHLSLRLNVLAWNATWRLHANKVECSLD